MMMNSSLLYRVTLTSLLLLSFNVPAQPQTGTSAPAQTPAAPRDERLWKRALEIHRKSVVIDGHNDITEIMVDTGYDLGTPSVGKYHTDLARLKESGMTGQFFSVYVDRKYATKKFVEESYLTEGGAARRAMDLIDVVYRAAEKYPNDISMAYSTADIRRAKCVAEDGARGRVAARSR